MISVERLREVLEAPLRWLYPDRCELCKRIGKPAICQECLDELQALEERTQTFHDTSDVKAIASVYAFEGRAAQAVKQLKYNRSTALAAPMAQLLFDALPSLGLPDFDQVVAVPIHASRKSLRGFNQAELLCEAFPDELLQHSRLARIRATPPQVGLDRASRLTNLIGAFEASPDVAGERILLVDDVTTTGGTLLACGAALRQRGAATVIALTFCGEVEHPAP